MLGSTEIIVLVVVIGVLIFGANKIPELAKTFGKAKGEFEKGIFIQSFVDVLIHVVSDSKIKFWGPSSLNV